MYEEIKMKKSELVSINLISMDVSVSDISSGTTPYAFSFKAGDIKRDKDDDFLIITRYNAEYNGLMRLFNARIVDDSHYIPINILYILYKIASTVNAESIKLTYCANAKIDQRYYDLISDYYNVAMNITIDNDKVYKRNADNEYNDYNRMTYTDYDSILEEIKMLRMARKLLINDDLSNVTTDSTMKGYMYNTIFSRIAYKIKVFYMHIGIMYFRSEFTHEPGHRC